MLTTHLAGTEPLHGRRVKLLPVAPEHAPFLHQCYQDNEFMDLYRLAQSRKETVEQITARLREEQKQMPNQKRRFEWVIFRCNAEDEVGEFIGLASVADFQYSFRRGEFLIGILNSQARKMGIGLEASLLVLEFAFNELKLHKFVSFVYRHNQSSQHNTLQLGFRKEGLLRDHLSYQHTGFIDLYQNALLENEFRTNKRLARLSKRLLGWDVTQKKQEPNPLSKKQLLNVESALKQFMGVSPTDAKKILEKEFTFPLNAYAQALLLKDGEVNSLHYGLFSEKKELLSTAQQRATDKIFSILPSPPQRL